MTGSRRALVVDDGPGVWGSQRVILRLAPFLEAAGFDLALAAPGDSGFAQSWRDTGRVLHPLRSARRVRTDAGRHREADPRLVADAAVLSGEVTALLRRNAPDVVVGNSYWGSLAAAAASRLVPIPSVVYLHEEVPRRAIRRATTTMATASIAVSRRIAGRLDPPSRRDNQVIPNGVDTVEFAPGPMDPALRAAMAADPGGPVVLYAGRLDPEKQVDHVIDAVAGLPGVQLAVVGSSATIGDGYERGLRRRGDARLGPRVRFLGKRADVAALLRNADAVALSGRAEGMSLGLLEAMAAGCPVVAYPAAGVDEVVTGDVTAALAAMGDRVALGDQLARVLDDPGFGHKLGAEARRHVQAHHSLERQAALTVGLLQRVA